MRIRSGQIKALILNKNEELTTKLYLFLKDKAPQWCLEKKESEIIVFIQEMIKFCRDSKIYKEENMQKIMLSHIEHNFDLSFDGYIKEQLAKGSFDEDYRLESFILSLTSKKAPIQIFLDTDLTKFRSNCTQRIDSFYSGM